MHVQEFLSDLAEIQTPRAYSGVVTHYINYRYVTAKSNVIQVLSGGRERWQGPAAISALLDHLLRRVCPATGYRAASSDADINQQADFNSI